MNTTQSYKKVWDIWFNELLIRASDEIEETAFENGNRIEADNQDSDVMAKAWDFAERDFKEFSEDNDLHPMMTFNGFKKEFE